MSVRASYLNSYVAHGAQLDGVQASKLVAYVLVDDQTPGPSPGPTPGAGRARRFVQVIRP